MAIFWPGLFRSLPQIACEYSYGARNISTSSALLGKRRDPKNPRKWNYDTKEARFANMEWDKRKFEEIKKAQKIRNPEDYPVGPDQRATWKHRRWYDEFYNKWVSTNVFDESNINLDDKSSRSIISTRDTVDEKLHIYLEYMTKKKFQLNTFNKMIPKNASYFAQHLTNTKYLHGLPLTVESIGVDEKLFETIKELLIDAIKFEREINKTKEEYDRVRFCKNILTEIFDCMSGYFHKNYPHETEVDINAENAMFWMRGRGDHHWTDIDSPFYFQTYDHPLYQLRSSEPIPAFTPWMDDFMLNGEVPYFDYHPMDVVMEDKMETCHRNYLAPGVRSFGGDLDPNYQEAMEMGELSELYPPLKNKCLYGHTQFHAIADRFNMRDYENNFEHCDITEEAEEHLKHNGIMSGWTWTAAQAHFHGYWQDQDVNKSFQSQVILSDGEYISFYCYQLNTLAIDSWNEKNNKRKNICYGSENMKLFNVSPDDGSIEVNDEAIKNMIKFMTNGLGNESVSHEDIQLHNNSLQEQKFNNESPDLADQIPLHVARIKERELRLEMEAEKNMSVGRKVRNVLNRLVKR